MTVTPDFDKLLAMVERGWKVKIECTTHSVSNFELDKDDIETIVEDYEGNIDEWLYMERPEKYLDNINGEVITAEKMKIEDGGE